MTISLRKLALLLQQTEFNLWVSPVALVQAVSGEKAGKNKADPVADQGAMFLASTTIQVLNLNDEVVEVLVKMNDDNGKDIQAFDDNGKAIPGALVTFLTIPPRSMRDLRWTIPGTVASGWVSVSCSKPVYPAGWFNTPHQSAIPMTFYPRA